MEKDTSEREKVETAKLSSRSRWLTIATVALVWPPLIAAILFAEPGPGDLRLAAPIVLGIGTGTAGLASIRRDRAGRP